ncbi:MAG: histidine phosphatase family protein [Proteobacteria bacterium]|nr:histidine phosphatase family protein [Pseudomonadota bacterium]
MRELPDIVLLRHGETHWNRTHRYQGQLDSPLTLVGIQQIKAVARTLEDTFGDLSGCDLWASPLGRTVQSMAILCEELDISFQAVNFDARLKERAYGRWETHTRNEVAEKFADELAREKANLFNYRIESGGESFADVAARMDDFMRGLPKDRPALIMSHGGCGRVIRGLRQGLTPADAVALSFPQTTITMFTGRAVEVMATDPQHLDDLGCPDAGLGMGI